MTSTGAGLFCEVSFYDAPAAPTGQGAGATELRIPRGVSHCGLSKRYK
jgi:hypothetical protein